MPLKLKRPKAENDLEEIWWYIMQEKTDLATVSNIYAMKSKLLSNYMKEVLINPAIRMALV